MEINKYRQGNREKERKIRIKEKEREILTSKNTHLITHLTFRRHVKTPDLFFNVCVYISI